MSTAAAVDLNKLSMAANEFQVAVSGVVHVPCSLNMMLQGRFYKCACGVTVDAEFIRLSKFSLMFGSGKDKILETVRRMQAKPGGLGRLGVVIGSDVQYCSACGANIADDDGHCSNVNCWKGRNTEPLQRAMIQEAVNAMR